MLLLFATTLFVAFLSLAALMRQLPVYSIAAGFDWAPIQNAVATTLGLVITALGGLLLAWFRSKLHTDRARSLFDHVAKLVETEVRAIAQSTLPEVRAAMADGKITPEEASRLRHLVIDRVRMTLGRHGLLELRALLGDRDVDSWLASLIESEVLRVKTDSPRLSDVSGVLL
jgi:uncharacterized membrane protein (DUF485 family)